MRLTDAPRAEGGGAGRARHTDYADNINPSILHRKEGFVPADHPRRAEFEGLTQAEEEAGLYEDATTIGFKLNWERLRARKGLRIHGHRLNAERKSTAEGVEPRMDADEHGFLTEGNGGEGETRVVVERHRTALTRYDLSKPSRNILPKRGDRGRPQLKLRAH